MEFTSIWVYTSLALSQVFQPIRKIWSTLKNCVYCKKIGSHSEEKVQYRPSTIHAVICFLSLTLLHLFYYHDLEKKENSLSKTSPKKTDLWSKKDWFYEGLVIRFHIFQGIAILRMIKILWPSAVLVSSTMYFVTIKCVITNQW